MKLMFPDNPFRVKTKKSKQALTHRKIKPHEKWKTVQVGESWSVPYDTKRRVYHAACTHGWRYDKKFSYKLEGDLMKITRVK